MIDKLVEHFRHNDDLANITIGRAFDDAMMEMQMMAVDLNADNDQLQLAKNLDQMIVVIEFLVAENIRNSNYQHIVAIEDYTVAAAGDFVARYH